MNKIIIGVTDCSKYENYSGWIQAYGKEVEIVKLSEKIQNFEDAKRCQGILFTGGEDVHPGFYGKQEYLQFCHKTDVSELRDEFELKLMEFTQQQQVPVLGICRGMQLYNVFAGGTLIPDIPAWGKFNHSKIPNGKDRYHSVLLDPASWLVDLIKETKGIINSNHHQATDRMGANLVVSAFSEDGVAEAAERKDPQGQSFLGLVQWHPERMDDQKSPFVSNIKEAFMNAAQSR
jgi:putative glutamine amidotransferase